MAGGIFPEQPFSLNAKCVIFSLIIMGLLLVDPRPIMKNKYILVLVLFIVFVVAYVAMAWYDYYFDCRVVPLVRAQRGITTQFKPPMHVPNIQATNKEKQKSNEERFYDIVIYASHLIFIVPFIAYIAYKGEKTPYSAFVMLAALAVFTAFYHGIHLINIYH